MNRFELWDKVARNSQRRFRQPISVSRRPMSCDEIDIISQSISQSKKYDGKSTVIKN